MMGKEMSEEDKLKVIKSYLETGQGKKLISDSIRAACGLGSNKSILNPKKGVMASVLEKMESDKGC